MKDRLFPGKKERHFRITLRSYENLGEVGIFRNALLFCPNKSWHLLHKNIPQRSSLAGIRVGGFLILGEISSACRRRVDRPSDPILAHAALFAAQMEQTETDWNRMFPIRYEDFIDAKKTRYPKIASLSFWLRRQDSNLRPPGYEPDELPTALLRDMGLPSRLEYCTTGAVLCQAPFCRPGPTVSAGRTLRYAPHSLHLG